MSHARAPAVAGYFYPEHATELAADLERLLDGVPASGDGAPKAIIAPHAGYLYSGPIAASAYALLRGADHVRRVVMLGPAHRVAVRGMALPQAELFATPLGEVRIDSVLREIAAAHPKVCCDDRPHANEHSLEVHLPFLQHVLGSGFTLLPLVVGDIDAEQVAGVLEQVWGGPETLIVVSTDLSHFHDYERAVAIDQDTVAAILARRTDLHPEQACGCRPVNGLMRAAADRDLRITSLDVRNSGDTAGDRSRVVGYASFALHEPRRNT